VFRFWQKYAIHLPPARRDRDAAAKSDRSLVRVTLLDKELQHFHGAGIRNGMMCVFIFFNEIRKYVEISLFLPQA